MDFKIKIDLSSQELLPDTSQIKAPRDKKKKKNVPTENNQEKTTKPRKKEKKEEDKVDQPINKEKKEEDKVGQPIKKRSNKKAAPKQKENVESSVVKLNSNSMISLTLPNLDNLKGDQAQKLSMIVKKKPRHWEKRWVLVPNVFEFTKEIWLKKWVLVDGGEDIVENDVSLYLYRTIFNNTILVILNLIKKLCQRSIHAPLMNVGRSLWMLGR
jgi:hypothetical protein